MQVSRIIKENLFIDSKTFLTIILECNIPILIASGFISFAEYIICFFISFGGIDTTDLTPLVF